MTIPRLYETEDTSLEEKMIYERWEIPFIDFYWLIAELEPANELAFGYANLNDDDMAEWGYFGLQELKDNGAVKLNGWEPRKFREVMDNGHTD